MAEECGNCNGTGKIGEQAKGGKTEPIPCPVCKGTGETQGATG